MIGGAVMVGTGKTHRSFEISYDHTYSGKSGNTGYTEMPFLVGTARCAVTARKARNHSQNDVQLHMLPRQAWPVRRLAFHSAFDVRCSMFSADQSCPSLCNVSGSNFAAASFFA